MQRERESEAGAPERARATILVVDDSPAVLTVARDVLSEAGYTVACIDSGAQAVDEARRVRPDLVVVDFAMPGVNGFGVCKALGEDADLESIPIVIMNTRGDRVGERFVREMGIKDHLTKPFAPEVLLALVQHVLEVRGGAEPQPSQAGGAAAGVSIVGLEAAEAQEAARLQLATLLAGQLQQAGHEGSLEADLEAALEEPLVLRATQTLTRASTLGTALTGDLQAVAIADVMQMLALQRQSGVLRVRHGAKEVAIALHNGALRLVTGKHLPGEFLLGSVLVQEKIIDSKRLRAFLRTHRGGRWRVGTRLVKHGLITREQLHMGLRRQSAELIYELLRWNGGEFGFQRLETLPRDVLDFQLDLSIDETLMEGYRRVDEWGLIEAAIPSLELVPRRVRGAIARLGDDGLTAAEQRVYDAVNGRRTVRSVIERVGLGSFEGARRLYRLVAARVVTMR